MQVFFAWVAAQKLSSCKQRIITSCTSGLHNKRYGSTNYDARSASRGNLRAILIVFIFFKNRDIPPFSLQCSDMLNVSRKTKCSPAVRTDWFINLGFITLVYII